MPTVEERLASLEEEVARLKAAKSTDEANALPWWEKIRGTFKDDPDYDEAMRLGRLDVSVKYQSLLSMIKPRRYFFGLEQTEFGSEPQICVSLQLR